MMLRKVTITVYYNDVYGEVADGIVSDLLDNQEIESVHVGDPESVIGAVHDDDTGTWTWPV